MATRKEMNRTSGVARRKAPNASYNNSPFKGSDPLSQVASFAWRLPGAIASGRTLSGRKVTGEEVSGLAAMAALTAAGIYAGTKGVRGTRPASKPSASRSGARPMTAAESSSVVTRNARKGVGKIGPSIKPQDPNTYEGEKWDGDFREPFWSYESAIYRGQAALNRKAVATRTPIKLPSHVTDVSKTGNPGRYKGFTTRYVEFDDFDEFDSPHITTEFRGVPEYMKKTIDWRAERLNPKSKIKRK